MIGMGYFHPVIGDESGVVGGRELRYVLTWRIRQEPGPVSVAELARWCDQVGIVLTGRPSKVISDSLRWEVIWGRVERVSRGLYRFGRVPRSTWVWIKRRVQAVLAHLGWVQTRRNGDRSAGPAPIWGPGVTTPPWSGRRARQPVNPVLRSRPRRFKRLIM